jgi:hypothetical protein
MTTEGIFSLEKTTIYVSTSLKLNSEQTQSVTDELLHIMGCHNRYQEFNFQFIDEGDLIEANASVDNELRVSVRN